MRRGLLGVTTLMAALVAAGAAPVPKDPPWVSMVAGLATADVGHFDIQAADAALRRLAFIGPSPGCAPRIVVPANGVAHVNAVFVGACDTHAPVLSLQVLIEPASPAAVAAVIRAITASAGAPCFSGLYKPEPRRRAPPMQFTAWVNAARDLVLTQDSSMPGALSVALINKAAHPAPGASPGYPGMLEMVRDTLPAACKGAGAAAP